MNLKCTSKKLFIEVSFPRHWCTCKKPTLFNWRTVFHAKCTWKLRLLNAKLSDKCSRTNDIVPLINNDINLSTGFGVVYQSIEMNNLQKTLFIKLILIHYPKKKKTDAKYLYKRCYLEKNLQPLKGWRSIWTPCGFSINVSSREMVKTCLFVTFKTVIRQLSLKDFIEIPQVF